MFKKLIASIKKRLFRKKRHQPLRGKKKKRRLQKPKLSRKKRVARPNPAKRRKKKASRPKTRKKKKFRPKQPSRRIKIKKKKKTSALKRRPIAKSGQKNAKRTGLKSTSQPPLAKKKEQPKPEILVGEITHYFSKIKVCVVKVAGQPLRLGDHIVVRGNTTNLKQNVESLQIENSDVSVAPRGKLVGLKIKAKVRPGDKIYKVLKR